VQQIIPEELVWANHNMVILTSLLICRNIISSCREGRSMPQWLVVRGNKQLRHKARH